MVNQARGLLAEYGITIPQGIASAYRMLPEILDREVLSNLMVTCIAELYEHLKLLDKKVTIYDKKIEALYKTNEVCKKLATIPGIGKLTSTILASILGNGSGFKNGRHFAAFLGLTPKQHSSGNKECLLGISKGGDTYVRTLLIQGAQAVMRYVNGKTDKQSMWIRCLMLRCCNNKAAVALANRMARIAWAIVHENTEYNPSYKPSYNKTNYGLARYGTTDRCASLARMA